jgi:hypothetical protein
MATPVVSSILPTNVGPQGGILYWLQIVGEHFTDGGGVSAVDFGVEVTTDYFFVLDDITLECGISIDALAALGSRTISVTNGDGTGSLVDGFTVTALLAPSIYDPYPVDVSIGYAGQSSIVIGIYGYAYLTGTTDVDFGADITIDSFTVVYDNYIEATISIDLSATPGTRDLTITNTVGNDVCLACFTVTEPLPVISGIAPRCVEQDESLLLNFYGTDFSSVFNYDFGADITVNLMTVVSDTEIVFDITVDSAATVGSVDIYVENTSGWCIVPFPLMIIPKANVTGCSSSCMVTAGSIAGGFIGFWGDGTLDICTTVIRNCYATGNVVSLGGPAGGFAGVAGDTTYVYGSRCYATGNATGYDSAVGGFVGSAYAYLCDCYSRGDALVT